MFLRELRREPAPTVVVFEDVHWADEGTLDLLRFVGWRVDDTRALLIATFRSEEVTTTHPLRLVFGDLAGALPRRGDPEVWGALDEALELAEGSGTLQRIAPVRGARAEAAWLKGSLECTVDEADAALDLAVRKKHAWFVGELAYWGWKAGRTRDVPSAAARPFAFRLVGRLVDSRP